MCKWEVDSRLVFRKLVCLMILAVESGIHELGTVSQSVSVHCAGRRCPLPWATTLDGGHGVMGAICFVSCSRDGLLHCCKLSDVYYLLTCDLLSFNGGKEGVAEETELRSQNQCCVGLWTFKEPPVPWPQQFQNRRFLDKQKLQNQGSRDKEIDWNSFQPVPCIKWYPCSGALTK